MLDKIPPSIRKHIEEAKPEYETPKKEDFKDINFKIFGVLPRRGPIMEASKKAEMLGYSSVILTEWLQAEAAEAGKVIASIARNIEVWGKPFKPPCILLTTGELIVTVGENRGIGGRNQEFALSAALQIKGSKRIIIGAVDTDGTDGPGTQFVKEYEEMPCLAGGLVDGSTAEEAEKLGIDLFKEIKNHNSTIPLIKLGDGIITTQGISLGDLGVTLIMGS
jgi:glycerate-2-kinase